MRLKYVGPHDEVDCLGRIVKRGETAEFSAVDAGTAPSVSTDADGDEVRDPGTGLLAQPNNWQPVKVATTKTKEA